MRDAVCEKGGEVVEGWDLPEINQELCTFCGQCVTACPYDAVRLTDAGPVIARPEACSYCGVCEEICPEGAIRLPYIIIWGEDQEA